MLSVNVAEQRSQPAEQGDGDRPAAGKGARLAARMNFAHQQQLALFHLHAGLFERLAEQPRVPAGGFPLAHLEDGRHPRHIRAGADDVSRGAAAEQKPECVHHN